MADKKKFYLTTAIAYTSGKPHIGNTYEVVLADSIVRFKRQQGYDVRFQTGTDEHGQKIELKAQEAGVTPKQFVDDVSGQIKTIWDLMNTSYDKFIRTTDPDHEKQVHHHAVLGHLHPDALGGHLLAAHQIRHIGVEQAAHALRLQRHRAGDGRHHILGDLDGAERLLVGQIILIFRHTLILLV